MHNQRSLTPANTTVPVNDQARAMPSNLTHACTCMRTYAHTHTHRQIESMCHTSAQLSSGENLNLVSLTGGRRGDGEAGEWSC